MRNIPYGYQYQNGVVAVNPKESELVSRIISLYLEGLSLKSIADKLNREGVEYDSGVTGWNKARLMRIIEDERYIGACNYPILIDKVTHDAAVSIKYEKNTQKYADRHADIYRLDTPVICGLCGYTMRRRYDGELNGRVRWICCGQTCGTYVDLPDKELFDQLTIILNRLIENPNVVCCTAGEQYEPISEAQKLESEIGRMLDRADADEANIREKLLECLSIKYSGISNEQYITHQLQTLFERTDPMTTFSLVLLTRTVKEIRINRDSTVGITLMNNQRFQKEG